MRIEIEPARIDRVHQAMDGTLVYVDEDVGGVAAALKRLDPCLRLVCNPDVEECWIVYRLHRDGRPIAPDDFGAGRREELVGTYRELDHRIVKRLEYIDPQGRGGYDFVKEVERKRVQQEKDRRHEFSEQVGEAAERTAHALRKDLGLGTYRGRVFIPRDVAA